MSIIKNTQAHINSLSYIAPCTSLHTQVSGNFAVMSTCTFVSFESVWSHMWTCIEMEIASLAGPGLYARSGETELEGLLTIRTAFSPTHTLQWVPCRHPIRSVPLPASIQQTLVRLTSRKWLDVDFTTLINHQ